MEGPASVAKNVPDSNLVIADGRVEGHMQAKGASAAMPMVVVARAAVARAVVA